MASFFNMEANGDPLSQSHDSGGQDIQADGEEAKITYLVVDNEGGWEKVKCDGCDKMCGRSSS